MNQRSNFAQVRGNRGGNRGNRRGGSNRRTHFSGLNVVYDAEGNEYPIDEDGNLVLEFVEEEDAVGILAAVMELPWGLVSIGVALVPVSRIW